MDDQFGGINGFLPWRASIMLDVVFVAMFVVIPVMGWSIRQAKNGRYGLHKKMQLGLGLVLLVAVGLFEVDMQFFTDWRARAKPSQFYNAAADTGLAIYALWVHLFFAVTTTVLWIFVIVQGVRKIPNPPGPCAYSRTHVRWAKLAAVDMVLTAVTGWTFYVLAFVL